MDPKPITTEPTSSTSDQNVIHHDDASHGAVGHGAGGNVSRPRLIAIAGAAAIVVIGSAGYVFGYYLPNKPENIYKSALVKTGDGYDSFVNYINDKELTSKYKTVSFDGDMNIDSAGSEVSSTFQGKMDENNSTFSGEVDLGVAKIELDGVVKDVSGSESPDVYMKVKGIEGLGANFGMPAMDTLDSQWISVDHSIIERLVNQASSASGVDVTSSVSMPSQTDVADAARAVGAVSKKYLFTTDPANEVFKMKEYVGKETVDGKATNHYKVNVDKAHLKSFAKELGKALDKSKLNDWAKDSSGKSLSKLIDTDGMADSADGIKDGDTFDVWVNTSTKLVHKVRFTDSSNKSNYMDLGFNYSGGDEKLFFINFHAEDDTESDVRLNMSVNT
ncbi:MAG TPA: hypothetical protein VF809_00370, partial [Candidatus Saccharimonadales bacterium]